MDQIQKYRLKNAVETAFNLLIEEFKDECDGDAASLARDDLEAVRSLIERQPTESEPQVVTLSEIRHRSSLMSFSANPELGLMEFLNELGITIEEGK